MRHIVLDGFTGPEDRPISGAQFSQSIVLSRGHTQTPYYAALIAILIIAFVIRVPMGLSRVILHDEFYHYFAGLSFAQDGTLAIGAGHYVRAAPYTALTGLSMLAFGDGLLALRLPAMISGILLVASVALWLQRWSRPAALVAAGLMAVDTFGLQLAGFARFYTLHALMVWLASIGTYALITQPRPPFRKALLAAGIAGALALALDLQILTLISIVALALWAVLDFAIVSHGRARALFGRKLALTLIVLACIALAILAMSPLGELATSLYDRFWNAALWSQGSQSDYLFYFQSLRSYGLLTYLFPVALVAAWRSDRRMALFLAMMFVVPVLIASIAPQKAPRYIFYAIPFFLAIWAIAAAWALEAATQHASRRNLPGWSASALLLAMAVLLVGSAYNFRSNAARLKTFAQTGDVVSGEEMRKSRNFDWAPWTPMLRQAVSGTEKLVGVDDMRTLYFLGRLDLMLNRTVQWDLTQQEFARDTRTGVLMASQPRSIELYIKCTRSGAIIVPEGRWREFSVIPSTADAIQRHATRVNLPADAPFQVYRWNNRSVPQTGDCAAAPFRRGRRAA